MVTGYLHKSYAESLIEYGIPHQLPRSGGWILKREIPVTTYRDAMGCYPLFTCENWSQLAGDLDDIGQELISLALVTDPFGKFDTKCLKKTFEDVFFPFKEHFVVDLNCHINEIATRHHRYYARQSLKKVSVEVCHDPTHFIDDWIALYATLIKRYHIKGLCAFSRSAFVTQFNVPGMVMLRVVYGNVTVGAQLWFVQNDVAYSHLTAFSEVAYKLRASYGLYWTAIEYFAGKLRWLDLGGGAGLKNNGSDGLNVFKRGWSTGTRKVYFCGRIFNKNKYDELVRRKNAIAYDYFPAYRHGEFE